MIQILVHMANSEPVKVDVDDMPDPTDTLLICRNPRDRGDREVAWIDEGVSTIVLPWWRINYIQVLPSEDDEPEFPMLFRND
jgi:hypothetical protein